MPTVGFLCAPRRLIVNLSLHHNVLEDTTERCGVPPHYYNFFLHVSDYETLLAHPRGRYILTGRLFVAGLDANELSKQVTPWMQRCAHRPSNVPSHAPRGASAITGSAETVC
jgi:hypothetical protein